MNPNISVVIITKNEVEAIGNTLEALMQISSDIIIADNGSTDGTQQLAMDLGAKVFETEWLGYGATKNFGNTKASNDWILSIDADEVLSPELINSLNTVDLQRGTVFYVKAKVNYCGSWINYSEWQPKYKPRLFHRLDQQWNTRLVHEELYPLSSKKHYLKGLLHHYSYKSVAEHRAKNEKYAKLSAMQWIQDEFQPSFIKLKFGPIFRFIKSYIIKLGFLQGKLGYQISKMNAEMLKNRNEWYEKLKSNP